MTTWNVDDVFAIDIYRDEDNNIYDGMDNKLPDELADLLKSDIQGFWDVLLRFNSSGSYHPGCYSGPPEYCYPDEYDDERVVYDGVIRFGDEILHKIPKDLLDTLANMYYDEIYEVPIDTDDEPDPDYMRDLYLDKE